MIGYVTFGSNDLERASAFYDELLSEYGAKRRMDDGRIIIYGAGGGQPMFGICKPHDGQAATVGNGAMVALACESKEQVQRLYEKALELGGSDEGAPGPRGGAFHGGYFRDLDGNKFVAFCIAS